MSNVWTRKKRKKNKHCQFYRNQKHISCKKEKELFKPFSYYANLVNIRHITIKDEKQNGNSPPLQVLLHKNQH